MAIAMDNHHYNGYIMHQPVHNQDSILLVLNDSDWELTMTWWCLGSEVPGLVDFPLVSCHIALKIVFNSEFSQYRRWWWGWWWWWWRWCMMYYICYIIFAIWYLIFDIWDMISNIWYLIYDIKYMRFDFWYLIYGIWYLIFDLWYLIFGIWHMNSYPPASSNMTCWKMDHLVRWISYGKKHPFSSGIFQLAMFDYQRVYHMIMVIFEHDRCFTSGDFWCFPLKCKFTLWCFAT